MKKTNRSSLWLSALALLLVAGCGGDGPGGPTPSTPTPVTPTTADKVVVYEAYPGMFGESGGLQGITSRLDEIQEVGANVLWLMPIYEQGTLTEGDHKAVGSPYCVKDYYKVNASYGTLGDLKALVNAAHGKGIRVILDWVGNHTSWDSAWITEHPDWYTHDANGGIISPPGFNWYDVADLNYSNIEMRRAMLDAMKWWVTEADVDGFRCDYADGVPADFWTAAITELRATGKGSELLMLAESSSAEMFAAGFDMNYAWSFASTLQGLYSGTKKAGDLYSTHAAEYSGVAEGKHRLRMTTNHDMNNENATPTLYKSLDGAFSAYVIVATMGGCPMIYGSQEIGYDKTVPFFRNYQMDWSLNPAYREKYEKLMSVRAGSAALLAGESTTYNVDDRVVCYKRVNGAEEVFVVVNTSGTATTIGLPLDVALSEVTDMMDGSRFTTATTLALGGYDYKIWEN
uniref:Glycoside hydrolase family 13 protein n=1 Tax=termite gut metagenome TaxID=433724 RepID=S0DGB6_9ZZZZ